MLLLIYQPVAESDISSFRCHARIHILIKCLNRAYWIRPLEGMKMQNIPFLLHCQKARKVTRILARILLLTMNYYSQDENLKFAEN